MDCDAVDDKLLEIVSDCVKDNDSVDVMEEVSLRDVLTVEELVRECETVCDRDAVML